MFAIVATAAMLSTIVNVTAVSAATFPSELQGAYEYAYGMGITTQGSIDSANMYGTLIRSHMAKMMVAYAKELGKTADTSVSVNFTDVAGQSAELQTAMTEAAQMGLMGLNADGSVATKFNPTGVVTRAQFGTVLSRVLYGDANNGSTPYYKAHLDALKAAGVMTKIDTPNANEVRGYVMLMMQRADESSATKPAICTTPENIMACTIGIACPAECVTTTEVKAGSLSVSLDSSSPAGAEIPGSIPSFKTVVYKLTSDKDVRLDSVVLKRAGFGYADAINSAALFIDGTRISKNSSFNSTTDEVTLNITNGYQMKAGESVKIAVNTVISASTNNVGKTFNVTLKSVASSAQDVSIPSNLTSDTFKIAAADVAVGTLTQYSSVSAPKVGQVNAELFKFQIANANTNKSITLKSMMFKQLGDSDVNTNLSNFKLLADGVEVANASALNGKYLTFNNVNFEILKNKTPKFVITANVNGAAGKTIQFSIEKKMDIVATDSTYNQGANINIIDGTYDTISFTSIVVSAGKLTLERVNPVSTDLLRNKKDVILGQLELTNNAGKNLNLKAFGLNIDVTSWATHITGSTLLENVRVKVNNGSSYELTLSGLTGYADSSIDLPLSAGKTTLTVLADTKDISVGTYKVDMSWSSATTTVQELENDITVSDVSPTSLTWRQIQGVSSSASVTNVALAARTYVAGTDGIEVLRFKVKAGSASLINIKELNFSGNAALTDTTIKSAKLTWDGGSVTANIAAGKLAFNGININVPANTEKEISLAVGITKSTNTPSFSFVADANSYTAEDKDGTTTTIDLSPAQGRTITVTSVGTVSLAKDTSVIKYTHNVVAGSTADVAQYNVNTQYEQARIEGATVVFGNTITSSVSAVQLYLGDTKVGETTAIATNTATFSKTDLSNGVILPMDQKQLRVVIVTKSIDNKDARGVADQADYVSSITLSSVYGLDSGSPISNATDGTDSSVFNIAPVDLVLAKTSDGKFTLTSVKWSNTDYSGNALKVLITKVDLTKVSMAGVTGLVLTLPDGTAIASDDLTTPSFTVSNYELASGDTFNLAVTADASAYNSSRNLSLPKAAVTYTVNYNDGIKTYTTTLPDTITILQK